MKVHIGADAGTVCVHTVTATAAKIHDVDIVPNLLRLDDDVIYGDSGYLGADLQCIVLEINATYFGI